MDDKDDFNFDWRNTPSKDHPKGLKCDCPKCTEVRENIAMNQGHLRMKLCPDHYRVYFNEIFPKFPFMLRFFGKLFMKIGVIEIREIPYMQSDQCFYCRFGSGNRDNKTELPPVV